jgi:hypothetical protein
MYLFKLLLAHGVGRKFNHLNCLKQLYRSAYEPILHSDEEFDTVNIPETRTWQESIRRAGS